MTQDIQTLELAKIYESQGYYEEALKIYSFLNSRESTHELNAALKRMEKRMEDEKSDSHPEQKISQLLEKWLSLMALEFRMDKFKKIKSRRL